MNAKLVVVFSFTKKINRTLHRIHVFAYKIKTKCFNCETK